MIRNEPYLKLFLTLLAITGAMVFAGCDTDGKKYLSKSEVAHNWNVIQDSDIVRLEGELERLERKIELLEMKWGKN